MKKILLVLILIFYCAPIFSQPSSDFIINEAKREIAIYDQKIVYLKGKTLSKFGFNPDVDGDYETVWYQGDDEFYEATNSIDQVSSSSASDTQLVTIEGHTIDGDGVISFVVQTATLTGRTPVILSTPLYRSSRLRNSGSTDFIGDVYVYSGGTVTNGVPQVADSIHLFVPIGYNRSQKASTSLSSEDYWIITEVNGSVGISSGNNRVVDFWVEIREFGGVFERVFPFTATNSSGETNVSLNAAIIVRPRADIRVVALSSGSGTQVKAYLSGYLMKISE